MARKRASMREGPLAELFRKTEAAQRAESAAREGAQEPLEEEGLDPARRAQVALEETVEHVHDFAAPAGAPPAAAPEAEPELEPTAAPDPAPEATAARGAAR